MAIIKPLTVVNGVVTEHESDDVEFTYFRYTDATTGSTNNTFIGEFTGLNISGGGSNTGAGERVLENGTSNIACTGYGYRALRKTTSNWNTALGAEALTENVSGVDSVAIGYRAAKNNVSTTGGNFACGTQSMLNSTTAARNMALGDRSLWSNLSGTNNVSAGYQSGYYNLGSFNIFLGNRAGRDETGSNKLYVHNNESSEPIIFGDMGVARELIFYANINVDRESIFNQRYGDYDFTIRKQTSGDAYKYDAGLNTHVLDGAEVTLASSVKYSKVETITAASDTLDETNYLARCDCSSNNITINLPTAAGNTGLTYKIKKVDDTGNIITIDGNSTETIDGNETVTITTQYTTLTVISNGTNWDIV